MSGVLIRMTCNKYTVVHVDIKKHRCLANATLYKRPRSDMGPNCMESQVMLCLSLYYSQQIYNTDAT